MAGIFGFFDYAKPGRGVGKNEPPKSPLFAFFELLFRKFGSLVKLNLLFFCLAVVFIAPTVIVFSLYGTQLFEGIIPALPLLLAEFFLIGLVPLSAGVAIICRNYVRGIPVFLWTDFKNTIKSNLRQSLPLGVLDYFLFNIFFIAIKFYGKMAPHNQMMYIPLIICIVTAAAVLFMQYYIFTLMVTFELPLGKLIKNSLIFSLAGLFRNLLLSLFIVLLALLIYLLFPLSVFLVIFIIFGVFAFTVSFVTWPLINKYLMPKDSETQSTAKPIFKDNGKLR